MPEVLEIEGKVGWTEKKILCALRHRNIIGMVAKTHRHAEHPYSLEVIEGFMIYALHKKRLQLIKISGKNQDVYVALLRKLIDKLGTARHSITFLVDEEDLPMQRFLKEQGWRGKLVHKRCGDMIRFTFTKEVIEA